MVEEGIEVGELVATGNGVAAGLISVSQTAGEGAAKNGSEKRNWKE
jgi:hypothetical protein